MTSQGHDLPSTLLKQCRLVVTMDDSSRELRGASVVLENGRITYLGDTPPQRLYDEILDCSRYVVIPGLVNAHHHLYQTLTRGFPESSGRGLFDWLRSLYPIWAGLDEDMIYVSTRTGLAEMVLSGCTLCADHLYVFPAGSAGFIDAQVTAATEMGVRFHATRGSMDLGESRGGLPPDSVVQPTEVILQDSERLINAYHDPSPGAMLQVALAPCSPFSASRRLMQNTADLARSAGVRLHTHIAETQDEHRYSVEKFGVSPVELLGEVGWNGDQTWVAHCVHPSPSDIALLARGEVAVAHCPTSNMLLGSGLAPLRSLLDAGVRVGLGVDGSASNDANDLCGEVKQAVLVARVRDGVQALSVREAIRVATRGGAACLGRTDLGSIEIGKMADLVLFDGDDLACAGSQPDPLAGIVLGGVSPHTVLVGGRAIVRSGALVAHDHATLAREHNNASRRLLEKRAATA